LYLIDEGQEWRVLRYDRRSDGCNYVKRLRHGSRVELKDPHLLATHAGPRSPNLLFVGVVADRDDELIVAT